MSTDQPRTVPFNYWGENQSGSSTSTFYTVSSRVRSSLCDHIDPFPQQNAQPSYQLSAGPSRTGLISAGGFRPYGIPRHTHPYEHRNAETGQSTLTSPLVPYVGPLAPQPSGGKSETTADAENEQTDTEETRPVSNFYCSHFPHVTEWSSASVDQANQARPSPRTTAPASRTDAAGCQQVVWLGAAAGEAP